MCPNEIDLSKFFKLIEYLLSIEIDIEMSWSIKNRCIEGEDIHE